MLDIPSQPHAVDLLRQSDAMQALVDACARKGLKLVEVCRHASVTPNTLYAWRRCLRPPHLSKLVQVAELLDYEIALIDGQGLATDFRDLPACIKRIDRERLAWGISLAELEFRSGVSVSSFFAWKKRHRDPNIANIVALAMTFGFEVVMRSAQGAGDERQRLPRFEG